MGSGNSTHPIHRAGRSGDICVVRRFLNKPAILNRRDLEDMTCLHWAAQLGQIEIVQEMVVANGIELDAQDYNGWTPLMHACCRGHKSVVGTLLAAGASLEIESHDGRTATHRAATWKRLGPLDQLIEAGADVRHEARNKWTPLHCAAAAGDAHACAILVEAGADVHAKDSFGLKPLDVVADLTAADLVERCLTRGRPSSVMDLDNPPPPSQGTIPHPSSSSSSSSSFRCPSLPPKLESIDSAGTAVVGADISGRTTPGLSSLGVDEGPEGWGGGRGREGKEGPKETLTGASVKRRIGSGDAAVTAKRGSWSRPVRPCPVPEGDTGVGDDTLPSSSSVEFSSAPTKLSKSHEDIRELEERQRREMTRQESGGEKVSCGGEKVSYVGEKGEDQA